jgi:hypothetical protein
MPALHWQRAAPSRLELERHRDRPPAPRPRRSGSWVLRVVSARSVRSQARPVVCASSKAGASESRPPPRPAASTQPGSRHRNEKVPINAKTAT